MPPLNCHNYRHQFVQSPRSLHDHEQYVHNYYNRLWGYFYNQISFPGPSLSPSQLNYLHPHQSTRGKAPLLHNSSKLAEKEKIASDICETQMLAFTVNMLNNTNYFSYPKPWYNLNSSDIWLHRFTDVWESPLNMWDWELWFSSDT